MGRVSRQPPVDDGWSSPISSGLALSGFLFLVFVAFTLLAMGPLTKYDAYLNIDTPPRGWLPYLHVMDRIGQRAVCLPILGVVTFLLCRRQHSWRPAVVAVSAVFFLNLFILVLKLILGRGAPAEADPSFFVGGMAYPSGHSANIVLVYGLVAYLVGRYGAPLRRTMMVLWGAVVFLAVAMVIISVTLNWHWFADLVAGLLVGGVVLELTATANRAVPAVTFTRGWRQGLRDVAGMLRPDKSHGTEGSA